MATASKIKSAISSSGSSQRDLTRQLAGITEQLIKAQESSKLSKIKQQQLDTTFGTLSSALELAATGSEQIKQSAELDRNIKAFEDSLPESVRKEYKIDKADISLMDVFKGKSSLTDFISQENKYFLGEKELGTKYDVAARGKEIISKSLVKNLLESMDSPSMMDTSTKFLPTLEEPKLDFNLNKLYGQPDVIQIKSKKRSLVDGGIIPSAGDDPEGIFLGDIFDSIQRGDT